MSLILDSKKLMSLMMIASAAWMPIQSFASLDQGEAEGPDFYEVTELEVQGPGATQIKSFSTDSTQIPSEKFLLKTTPESEEMQIINGLIAIGKQAYQLISAGKPVVSYEAPEVLSLLPNDPAIRGQGVWAPELLTHWQSKRSPETQLIFKNKFGIELVKFSYYVLFQHSGKYQGRGAYLQSVQVIPTEINVFWGINFSAKVEIAGIGNRGSAQDPVAGAMIKVHFVNKTLIQHLEGTSAYSINGLGQVQRL